MDMLNAFMWKFLFPSVVLVVPEDPMVLCPCQLPAALGSGHHLSWFLCKTGWKSSPRVQSVPSQRGHAGSLGDDTSAVCRLCKSCGGKEGGGVQGSIPAGDESIRLKHQNCCGFPHRQSPRGPNTSSAVPSLCSRRCPAPPYPREMQLKQLNK